MTPLTKRTGLYGEGFKIMKRKRTPKKWNPLKIILYTI